ncbi:hypothetical protein [Amycolatopsis nigrescens]|uniref:hypothetical protein n=1 Tax=Amycolatopsis nigrescens TaxID=381445 RepID=UPI000363710B|nr:hypothetical protein [Amycolatopsis nigrescens]
MEQISIFSAEASAPSVADLAGVLCGQGQLAAFGRTAARLSVVVDEPWRAGLLAAECTLRGAAAQVARSDFGQPLVRTAFRKDLLGMATAWQPGAVKEVPPKFRLTGAALRMWALTGGRWIDGGYLLSLDEHAPETHPALAEAIRALGVAGARLTGPGIKVAGRRRLAVLAELIGRAPPGAEPAWPVSVPARRAS